MNQNEKEGVDGGRTGWDMVFVASRVCVNVNRMNISIRQKSTKKEHT